MWRQFWTKITTTLKTSTQTTRRRLLLVGRRKTRSTSPLQQASTSQEYRENYESDRNSVEDEDDDTRSHFSRGEHPLITALIDDYKDVTLETVQELVNSYPGAVRERIGDDGMFPIHVAVMYSASLDKVKFLIRQWPECLAALNEKWGTPLHVAAGFAPIELVKYLANERPQAVQEIDESGDLPLHCAAGRDTPEVAQFLVERFREGLLVKNKCGWLPLHRASMNYDTRVPVSRPETDIFGRVESYGGVSYRLEACHVLQYLVREEPRALRERDGMGKLPMHRAASTRALATAAFLAAAWPQSLLEGSGEDGSGMLPVHIAAESTGLAMVQMLARSEPRALGIAAAPGGLLPLHVVAGRRAGWGWGRKQDVVEFLVDVFPGALQIRSDDNSLPVHCAARNGRNDFFGDALHILTRADPHSLQVRGPRGMLPLHLAAQSSESDSIVELLSRAYPEALYGRDDNGYLPAHYATVAACTTTKEDPVEILQVLLESVPENRPDVLLEPTLAGEVCLHLAAARATSLRVVEFLVHRNRQALQARCHRGWLPLHYATSYAHREVVEYLAREHPAALQVRTTDEGRLPIHHVITAATSVAATAGTSDSTSSSSSSPSNRVPESSLGLVVALAQMWPPALDVPDRYGYRPFLLAACTETPDERKLDLVYTLLRMCPDALDHS